MDLLLTLYICSLNILDSLFINLHRYDDGLTVYLALKQGTQKNCSVLLTTIFIFCYIFVSCFYGSSYLPLIIISRAVAFYWLWA